MQASGRPATGACAGAGAAIPGPDSNAFAGTEPGSNAFTTAEPVSGAYTAAEPESDAFESE